MNRKICGIKVLGHNIWYEKCVYLQKLESVSMFSNSIMSKCVKKDVRSLYLVELTGPRNVSKYNLFDCQLFQRICKIRRDLGEIGIHHWVRRSWTYIPILLPCTLLLHHPLIHCTIFPVVIENLKIYLLSSHKLLVKCIKLL